MRVGSDNRLLVNKSDDVYW